MGWIFLAVAILVLLGLLAVMPSPSEWTAYRERKRNLPLRKASRLEAPTHWWTFAGAGGSVGTGSDDEDGADGGDPEGNGD